MSCGSIRCLRNEAHRHEECAMVHDVEIHEAGAINLAGFVCSTAGRTGTVADICGGVAVAGPVPLVHGYVTTAVPTNPAASAADFVDEAVGFFAGLDRGFVLWAPRYDPSYAEAATHQGLSPHGDPTPAMVARASLPMNPDLHLRLVDDDTSAAVFGDLCERGYGQPGMAWLMAHHQSYSATDTYWHIASEHDMPVSVACGYVNGDVGGIYSVATPAEFRGRGFAAAVTAAATNHLFDLGALSVVLQASRLGFGVYERLGFTVYDHFDRFISPTATA
jgi:ribosomal protein S18 acetylase RimI-like enzyme